MADRQVNNLIRGKHYRYTYVVRFTETACNVRFGMLIKTTSGVELGGGVSAGAGRQSIDLVAAGTEFRVEFRFTCALNAGVYFLNAGVTGDINGGETYLHRVIDVAMFRVQSETTDLATGIVDFSCYPEVEQSNGQRDI